MLSLIIETCTDQGYVAIVENDNCRYYYREIVGSHQHSKYLASAIAEGLKTVGLSFLDLHAIVVGVGPGSYTGMRVGAAVAKTFSYALKIPLIGISPLQSYIPKREGPFIAAMDAKIGGVYLIKGVFEKGKVSYVSEPTVCPLNGFESFHPKFPTIVSPHCELLQAKFEKHFPNQRWHWEKAFPNPYQMVFLAKKKYDLKQYTTDGSLELLYLRG